MKSKIKKTRSTSCSSFVFLKPSVTISGNKFDNEQAINEYWSQIEYKSQEKLKSARGNLTSKRLAKFNSHRQN